MKDSREVNMTLPENAPPVIDPNVSMKNWEDGVCHLLIYAGDFPQDVLKTNSRNPEAANTQHEADGIYTGRTSTRTIRWLDTWDDARAWEFRNARGNTNVNLSQNSRMETNREYVSDVDTDTDSDAELDYKAKKCALRAWKCRCAPADVMEKCEHSFETYILRGYVLTTSMGGSTVIGRYMTVWILQNGVLSQQIASSQKKAAVRRRMFHRRMLRRDWFGFRHRT